MPLYHCVKIHLLSFSNKLSTEVGVFRLSWFLTDFSCFRAPKSLRVISQNLNKLHRPFFIFPDNLCCSIRIWQNIPSGVKVRALQSPQNGPRTQNFKIFTFSRGYCAKMLCVSSSEPILFCTLRGPLVIPPSQFWASPKILATATPGRPNPKKVFPQLFKNLSDGVHIFACAIRGPPRPTTDKISAIVPWPTSSEKNRRFLELCENFN